MKHLLEEEMIKIDAEIAEIKANRSKQQTSES
jgi:hypothetical protein